MERYHIFPQAELIQQLFQIQVSCCWSCLNALIMTLRCTIYILDVFLLLIFTILIDYIYGYWLCFLYHFH
jgi:hypothetical protein